MGRRFFASVLGLVLTVSAPALAKDPPAKDTPAQIEARDASRREFARGVAEMKAGRYPTARDAFKTAYRLYPHPSILLNLGVARARSGEYVEAEQDLERFSMRDNDATADEKATAEQTLAEVRTHLGTLRLRVTPDEAHATLDGKDVNVSRSESAETRVVAGTHVLTGFGPGLGTRKREVVVKAGEISDVTLDLGRLRSDEEVLHTEPRVAIGWAVFGGAVVSASVGTFAGLRALSLSSEYDEQPAGSQDPALRSEGKTLRILSDVSFGATIALVGVGLYLLFEPRSHAGKHAVFTGNGVRF